MLVAATKTWTLDELHSLPDDGNKYELIHGELFVTPAPGVPHEGIGARLARVLDRYADEHKLGLVLRPRSVVQYRGSECEPDLMVRDLPAGVLKWDQLPVPILVVEIASPATRRRDREQKRDFYLEIGVPEYWIVDGDARTVTLVRAAQRDVVAHDTVSWHPRGAPAPLVVDLTQIFGAM